VSLVLLAALALLGLGPVASAPQRRVLAVVVVVVVVLLTGLRRQLL
jgi:hypothetical protein